MAQLSSLSPKLIWHFFEQICSIPHPSKHEAKLSAWIIQWAQEEGLAVKQDKVGNIIIKKPATPGMENRKAVVLQAHIDMVPQANADTQHDFATDPIDAYVDGEWVTARGTTLGADNGIGMAGCLAVLADKTINFCRRKGPNCLERFNTLNSISVQAEITITQLFRQNIWFLHDIRKQLFFAYFRKPDIIFKPDRQRCCSVVMSKHILPEPVSNIPKFFEHSIK